ncbi:hypothetical protein [Heyndrickxia coagulans]|uniref:hypothetical protein n=1 Tax=Heyndrickxia coagulans TaxID=1398 RepID=UPI0006287331|nr:hypothetical protein [Heyndrickxia coagulans]
MQTFLHILLLSTVELVNLLGTIIVVGFVLGFLEKRAIAFIYHAFGWKGIAVTAWLGTPVHEFSHALMCGIFRHEIVEIKWLQLKSGDGTLGYVSHQYNPDSVYQKIGNFFIGTAPVYIGILILSIGMYVLLPDTYRPFMQAIRAGLHPYSGLESFFAFFGHSIGALASYLFSIENLMNPRFWIFAIAGICISAHISLSTADLKGAWNGCLSIFGFLVFLNVAGFLFGFRTSSLIARISAYNLYILAFSGIAFLFSLVWMSIGLLSVWAKKIR